jgi:hypothetical protein
MVSGVCSRLRAIIRAESRIDARIGEDADPRNQSPKNRIAVRACCRNRWILVTLIEKMNTPRSDVPDSENRGLEELPLNIEILLCLCGFYALAAEECPLDQAHFACRIACRKRADQLGAFHFPFDFIRFAGLPIHSLKHHETGCRTE